MKHFTLLAAMAISVGATAQITDGDFEDGPGSGAWTEASTNFDTPFCTTASCANGGASTVFVPFNGDFFLWFGGATTTLPEVGSVEQTANIPTGTDVTLSMWVKYPNAGVAGDYLRVMVDGNMVGEILPADSSLYVDYTGVGFDINSYAGTSHAIRIENNQTSGDNIQNILVDQVEILADGATIGIFENEAQPGIQVFPNPASDNLTLTFNALSGKAIVTIADLNGRVVDSQQLNEVGQRVFNYDAHALASGLYTVSVQQGAQLYTSRVAVEH